MQSNTTPYSSSLSSIVCRWSPSNLSQLVQSFSAACSKPQTTFPAYENYKSYFEPLLFAEISAELQSAFDKYQRSASTNSVSSHRPVKVRARREEPGCNPALVSVSKITRNHTFGFGSVVDVDPCDKKGPIGCVETDVVVVWLAPETNKQQQNHRVNSNNSNITPRQISPNASFAVVVRNHSRNGCRILISQFPSDSSNKSNLEEGEEPDESISEPTCTSSNWFMLRLGSLTTIRREFDALQNIRSSNLLPTLMKPNNCSSPTAADKIKADLSLSSSTPCTIIDPSRDSTPTPTTLTGESTTTNSATSATFANSTTTTASATSANAAQNLSNIYLERNFTGIVAKKLGLNESQTKAILHASTCETGFSVIQGPPGTGKTRTLIGLLNVIHMTQYHKFYEGLLSSLDAVHGSAAQKRNTDKKLGAPSTPKTGDGSLLETLMMAMNKTVEATMTDIKPTPSITSQAKRPRLLICAPSNSAVDEIVTRLIHSKFFDGHGRTYCPELARIGAGDKVSESVKALTAEGQAEAFLERVCPEDDTPQAQQEAQKAYLADWQKKSNHLLVQLERTPKTKTSSRAIVVDLHEKLERMERDLRRLSIAASDGINAMSREDKLRLIARTYVEDAQLVFATLSGSASNILTKTPYGAKDNEACLFDTVVIDEAAQATETSCLIPMTLGCSRCLLVGDPQQLPATVLSSGAAGLAYGQSLLERVFRAGLNVQLLDTQYRMHPAISSFPRRYFYSGRLVDDETVQGDNRARPFHRDAIKPKLGPYVFLDISEGEERRSRDDRSIFNQTEAELAAMIYSKIKKDYPSDTLFTPASKLPGSVTGFGVVTPYKRQMQELRQSFERAGVPTGDVEIDTVDSFQGREKDVVVFSCVRTAAVNRGIGFVRDVRRMNVGLTRARATLIILGSAQALAEGSKDWAELVEDASSRGCLLTVNRVERCLLPASEEEPAKDNNHQINTNSNENNKIIQNGHQTLPFKSNNERANGFIANRPKRKQGDPRMDPRRRSTRAAAAVTTMENTQPQAQIPKPQVQQNAGGDINPATFAGNFNNDGTLAVASDGTTLNLENGEDDPAMKEVLGLIRNALNGAGFDDSSTVEETLRNHLRKGGELDLETVIAAAIAASESQQQLNAQGVDSSANMTNVQQGQQNDNMGSVGTDNGLENNDDANSSTQADIGDDVPSEQAVPEQSDMTEKKENEAEAQVVSAPKEENKEEPQQKQEPEVRKEKMGEPSGWEMLFGGGGGGGHSGGPDNIAVDPRAVDVNNSLGVNNIGNDMASAGDGSENLIQRGAEEENQWGADALRNGKRTLEEWNNQANLVGNNMDGGEMMGPDGMNVVSDDRAKRMRGWSGNENGEIAENMQNQGYDPTMPGGQEQAQGFEGYGENKINEGEGMNNNWNGVQGMGYVGAENNNMAGGGGVVDGSEVGNPNMMGDGNQATAAAAAMGMYGDAEAMQAYQQQMMQQQQAVWQQQQALQQQAFQQQALMMQMSGMGGGNGAGNKGGAWYTGGFDQGMGSGSFGGGGGGGGGNGFMNQNGMGGSGGGEVNNNSNNDGGGRNGSHGSHGSWDRSGSRGGRNFRGGRGRARGRNGRRR